MVKRNYGIDLLRIVLMYMVCVLHILGRGGVLDASNGTDSHFVYWFLEILCYCAVDGFALISGYNASKKNIDFSKLVNMWVQVFFYSFVLNLVFYFLGFYDTLTLKECIKNLFPVTFIRFWYFSAYFGLFFVIPILNKYVLSLTKDSAKKILIITFLLFSVMEVVNFSFNSNDGYSFMWLVVLYVIGALIKKINLFKNYKSFTLLMLFIGSSSLSLLFYIKGTSKLISYVSPTILLNSIILVVLFSRIKPNIKFVKKVSPLTFGVYLFQLNTVCWAYLLGRFSFILDYDIIKGIVSVLLISLLLFVTGMIVEFLRVKLTNLLKIHKLSKYIVLFANKLLDRVCLILN